MLCDSVLEEECQKVLLHSINGHLRSSLFYDYLLVSDVLDINDLLDTRSLGMYSACMAPHFPALLCSVYRHCSFPRCYTSHCVCPSLNCVFPTALCCAQITSVVSNTFVDHNAVYNPIFRNRRDPSTFSDNRMSQSPVSSYLNSNVQPSGTCTSPLAIRRCIREV